MASGSDSDGKRDDGAKRDVHKQRMSAADRRASKPKKIATKHDDESECYEMVQSEALRGYETFHKLSKGSITLAQVVNSSAGIAGWSCYARSFRC